MASMSASFATSVRMKRARPAWPWASASAMVSAPVAAL